MTELMMIIGTLIGIGGILFILHHEKEQISRQYWERGERGF
jgi:hypothetical protein